MKSREFRELSIEELEAKSRELRGELFNVRIKRSTGQLENTAKLRTLRREIARTETILGEKRGATT
ncbi:MAG: 50S ribosomal protein L29 [Myxococcales bacterium]|nr:50S ribosomal protein L29 [Myxococcales bacterium]MDH5307970.1 50S ribosomal protein L29 [Myxococcales bacterium]MDH5565872.1 50S ribosomal protein L29 [Myxococcales bacterium]